GVLMPYLNRKAPIRKDEGLTPLVRLKLLDGFWFDEIYLDSRRVSDEELRQAWSDYRDELLAEHIASSPGSRPWPWWMWDAPEPRRRIIDGGEYTHYIREAGFGIPKNCDETEFESQLSYLIRLRLLAPDERR